MTLHAQPIDMHETMLEEMNEAIDRITLRPTTTNLPRKVRFGSILVGYDGTPASRHALEWAARLAELHGSKVVVASITPPLVTYGAPYEMSTYWLGMVEAHEATQRRMREAATDGATFLRSKGVDAESVETEGATASQLAKIAETHHADLVVLGAKGGGKITRVLGSVAEAISGRVPSSLLIARGPPDLRHILAATDGSPESDRAVTLGLELATAAEGDLVVQHVLDYHGAKSTIPPDGYLQGIVERMTLRRPPHVRYVIDMGPAAAQIVERAHDESCGLVLVGARGMGRVKGALLGSVSHRVANTAQASVLVVRGEDG